MKDMPGNIPPNVPRGTASESAAYEAGIGPVHRLVIHGAPRTKKTHNEVVRVRGRPVVMPSKQWRRWLRSAKLELPDLFVTIRQNVNCRALFYRDANRGDAVGYYQGLADFLERYGQIKRDGRVLRAGLIYSDQQIVSWDGSRLLVDRNAPRVEVELTIVSAHQLEVFHAAATSR